MLLIFSFGYAAWRMVAGKRPLSSSESSPPGYVSIGTFMLVLALASYLMRFIVPLGESVFDFPTLAYLPQYLSFYILGTIAYRRDWFRNLPGSIGVTGFVIAVVAAIFLFPLAFSGQWFSLELTPALDNAMGCTGSTSEAVPSRRYAGWSTERPPR